MMLNQIKNNLRKKSNNKNMSNQGNKKGVLDDLRKILTKIQAKSKKVQIKA